MFARVVSWCAKYRGVLVNTKPQRPSTKFSSSFSSKNISSFSARSNPAKSSQHKFALSKTSTITSSPFPVWVAAPGKNNNRVSYSRVTNFKDRPRDPWKIIFPSSVPVMSLLLPFLTGSTSGLSSGSSSASSSAQSLFSQAPSFSTIAQQEQPQFGDQRNKFQLHVGVSKKAGPGKNKSEDAYFINNSNTVVGVADGVGGWSLQGVDPSLYSNSLMEDAKAAADKGMTDSLQILTAAYKATSAKKIIGSSTACIVTIDSEKSEINSANLGDSGFVLLRKGKIEFESKAQQHSFNYPFQLGLESEDKPEHADVKNIRVEEGDIIILATDGLFDNMFTKDVAEKSKTHHDPQQLSDALVKRAFEIFTSSGPVRTPVWGFRSKPDDVTVVVATVTSNNDKDLNKNVLKLDSSAASAPFARKKSRL